MITESNLSNYDVTTENFNGAEINGLKYDIKQIFYINYTDLFIIHGMTAKNSHVTETNVLLGKYINFIYHLILHTFRKLNFFFINHTNS